MNDNSNSPSVLIILVNYKKWADTVRCVASLKEITYPNYEIVVVDNCSENDSVEEIAQRFPDIKIFQQEKNLGFAGASNVGIRYGIDNGFSYVLLLNNDTTVEASFLDELVNILEREKEVVMVAPTILYPGSKKIWAQGGRIDWLNAASKHGNENSEMTEINSERAFEFTDFVSGACVLVKLRLFNEIGFMREDYFMYLEDLDLCWRVRKHHKLAFSNRSIIYHYVGSSTGGADSSLSTYYVFRNKLYFISDNFGFAKKIMAYSYYFFYSVLRRYPVWLVKRKFNLIKAHMKGVLDFFRGIKGARKK